MTLRNQGEMKYFWILNLCLLPCILGLIPHRNVFLETLRNDLPAECVKTNNIEVDKVFQRLRSCLKNVVKPLFSNIFRDRNFFSRFVESLCRKPDLLICFIKAEDEVKVCLTKEKKEYFEYAVRSMATSLIYGCNKGGEAFKILFSKKGAICVFKAQPHFPHCAKLLPRPSKNTTLDFWFSEKNCFQQGQFARCIVHKVTVNCHDDVVANVFRGLFKSMFRDTPCERFYNASSNLQISIIIILFCLILLYIFCK